MACEIIRHIKYIRCRIRYEPMISYVMYIRCRTSNSDIRHRTRYVEMKNYDVVRDRHNVVRRHTTSYVTYDVAHTMSYVYILYITRTIYNTMLYVARAMSCVMHIRHRTYVRPCRWQESNVRNHFKLELLRIYLELLRIYLEITKNYLGFTQNHLELLRNYLELLRFYLELLRTT
jgi:hypothetical protein